MNQISLNVMLEKEEKFGYNTAEFQQMLSKILLEFIGDIMCEHFGIAPGVLSFDDMITLK